MASVASQLIEGVTAHAQSDSLEDAREICADGTYFPNNLRTFLSDSQCLPAPNKQDIKCVTGQDPIWTKKKYMFVEQGISWETICNRQQILLSFCDNVLNNVYFNQNLHTGYERSLHYYFVAVRFSNTVGHDSSVGIATRYGLDGPGIESRRGRNFPHSSRPVLGPTQLPIKWVLGSFPEKNGRGVALTTHPHLAPRLKKG